MSSAAAAVKGVVERQSVYAMLDDNAWWAENQICLLSAEAGVGDRVVSIESSRYSTRVIIFELTKVARKWRTILDVESKWPRENRCFISEFTNLLQVDPGNGVGSPKYLYGALDWELMRSEEVALEKIRAAGIQFSYGTGRGWSPESRIKLAGFLEEIGMVSS